MMGENSMKKRWLTIYVENNVGVLAKVSGLFAGKNYNLESLTVGETEDITVSRMTIGLTSDDCTFEQIKKQLNRCVEVIKVIDLTNRAFHSREILYILLMDCTPSEITEVFRIAGVYGISIVDYGKNKLLLECFQNEEKNNNLLLLMKEKFHSMRVVRGGSVAIEKN